MANKSSQTGKAGERHNAAFVVGSVLGGVIGAAATLWKAPQTGDELRHKLTSGGSGDEPRSGRVVSSVRTGSGRVLSNARLGLDRVARTGSTTARTSTSESTTTAPLSSKVLSFVERAAAPIVGVKLGQTANGSGPAASGTSDRITPIRRAATTTATTSTERPVMDDGGNDHGSDRATLGTYSGRSIASTGGASSRMTGGAATTTTTTTTTGQTETSSVATPSPASTDIPEGVPGHVPTTDELVTPTTPFVPEPNTAQQLPRTSKAFPDTGDIDNDTKNA
ncbi:MAG: YtxH domain-containing protein [Chloroflexota bacterium]|nr:YtxH domain-containing protein [Chloroflexota bacterium]